MPATERPRSADALRREFARARVGVPVPPARHLPRQRLYAALDARRQVTVVAAPAGFGKTTLLAGWLAATGTVARVAWLALEEDSDDPLTFLGQWIEGIRAVEPDRCATAAWLLRQVPAVEARTILVSMLNELAEAGGRWTFLFEDHHHVTTAETRALLAYALEHLPPGLDAVIVGRAKPDLPLARWRVAGRLTEIGPADLRFTADEGETFLIETMAAPIDTRGARALEARAEGWVAGLQMAALWLRDRDHPADAASLVAFDGQHRFVAGYLAGEVFESQSPDIRHFLSATALLDRFSFSLCDALLERDDSQAMIDRLRRAGLFLVNLDDRDAWFRYHDLFRDFLLSRLPATERPRLHRRAADWFAANGPPGEAIRHAALAGDADRAAALVRDHVDGALSAGEFAAILSWLDLLPDALVRGESDLAGYKAWLLYMRGRVGAAETFADLDTATDTAASGPLLAFRAFLAINRGRLADAETLARAAYDRLEGSASYYRPLSRYLLGTAQRLSGARKPAMETLREAAKLADALGNPMVRLEATGDLALLHHARGDLREASKLAEAALREDAAAGDRAGAAAGLLRIRLGQFLYDANALARARAETEQGIALAKALGQSVYVCLGQRQLARIVHAQGDGAAALDFLASAREIAEHLESPRHRRQIDVTAADFAVRDGDPAAARRLVGRSAESVPPTSRERLVEARLLLAEGRAQAADAILGELEQASRQDGGLGALIEPLALRARVAATRGDPGRAARLMAEAAALAVPAGFIRPLLDEGREAIALLEAIAETSPHARGFLRGLRGIDAPAAATADATAEDLLTDAENGVLRLLAEGRRNREIAEAFGISVGTTKWHVHNIYQKLEVNGRTAAVHRARQLGLI
ncbi:LuxR C-terminal-related transcriptional regulator [Amaricoccus sp. W119]|uniref:LuxR C-terminal-related transcriptional regulator n=1 Tax=Amaricoccus sp. W119 TaxID=3391833 RepID=UPI0039A624D4